jgi:hypothetical protein
MTGRWRQAWRRAPRLPFTRRPRDAAGDFDDASYDGGMSGGRYLAVALAVVIIIVVIISVVGWHRQ